MSNNSSISPNNDQLDVPHRYKIVAGTFLALFGTGTMICTFAVFFKPLSTQFGWLRAETSGAFSIAVIISGLMGVIAGRLVDKISPRTVIIGFGVIGGGACLLLSQMNALWQLYIFYGLLIGSSMANVIPTTSLVTRCFVRQRGLMTGITSTGGAVSSMIAAPGITKLLEIYDWSTSYIIVGVFILLIVVISGMLLRHAVNANPLAQREYTGESVKTPKVRERGVRKVLRSRLFWIVGVILFCTTFSQQMIFVHLIPYTTDIGISPLVAASMLSVTHVGIAMGSIFSGRVLDMIGSRLAIVMFVAVNLVAMLLFLAADSAWVFYVFAVLFGIAWGAMVTLRSTTIAEIFGLHSHGAITGAVMLISNIGGALSPLIAGYIFDISNGYQSAFLLTTSMVILALIMGLWLKFRVTIPLAEGHI